MYLPCKHGKFSAKNGKKTVRFNPVGKPVVANARTILRANPFSPWTTPGDDILSARFFVGFSVLQKPTWKMEDLIAFVRKLRKAKKKPEDSTFVYQKGVYTHSSGAREVVEEDSAQVIIFKTDFKQSRAKFEAEIKDLCDKLLSLMKQESIILEFQKNGTQYMVGEIS